MGIARDLYKRNQNDSFIGLSQREMNSYSVRYGIPLSSIDSKNLSTKSSNLSTIKSLQKVITRHPLDLDKRYELSQVFLDSGLSELAQTELETILKIYPNGALMWNDLGFLLIKLNRFEEAQIKLKRALEINPNFSNAHFNMATVKKNLNENNYAIFHIKKALSIYHKFNNEKLAKLSEKMLTRFTKSNKSNSPALN